MEAICSLSFLRWRWAGRNLFAVYRRLFCHVIRSWLVWNYSGDQDPFNYWENPWSEGLKPSNNSLPNKLLPNRFIPNKSLPNKDLPNRFLPNKSLPNKKLPNRFVPNKSPKQKSPNRFLPNKSLPNKMLPNESLPNKSSDSSRRSFLVQAEIFQIFKGSEHIQINKSLLVDNWMVSYHVSHWSIFDAGLWTERLETDQIWFWFMNRKTRNEPNSR